MMIRREVLTALQGYRTARETIYDAMNEGASPVALARLVFAREQAREEWETVQREEQDAWRETVAAARATREG